MALYSLGWTWTSSVSSFSPTVGRRGHSYVSYKESSGLEAEDPYRVDVLWTYLKDLKKPGTQECEFDLLFKVAEAIMTLPHSNAGEEIILHSLTKIKPQVEALNLDGSLSSLITAKTHIERTIQWNPSASVLENAKKATMFCNDQHRK